MPNGSDGADAGSLSPSSSSMFESGSLSVCRRRRGAGGRCGHGEVAAKDRSARRASVDGPCVRCRNARRAGTAQGTRFGSVF